MKIKPSLTQINSLRDRHIKKYYRLINKSILNDLQPLLNQIELGNITPNFEVEINIYEEVNELYKTVGSQFAKITRAEFRKVIGKKAIEDDVYLFIMDDYFENEVANLIVNVDDVIKNQIKSLIFNSINEGLSIIDLKKLLTKQIKSISKKRALVIARTETIKASNMGSLVGAEESGVDFNKEWITHFDSRTRGSHASANGQVVHKSEPFIVDGERLQAPGDTSLGASAGNVIQCRCAIGYIPILPKIFNE